MSGAHAQGGAVLDASALLAFLRLEPGWEVVWEVLPRAVLSSVNWAEVAGKAEDLGLQAAATRERLVTLGLTLTPFLPEDGEHAGGLATHTRRLGLSLGDRACLATAARLGLPAYTADRAWLNLDLGVEIRAIR